MIIQVTSAKKAELCPPQADLCGADAQSIEKGCKKNNFGVAFVLRKMYNSAIHINRRFFP